MRNVVFVVVDVDDIVVASASGCDDCNYVICRCFKGGSIQATRR